MPPKRWGQPCGHASSSFVRKVGADALILDLGCGAGRDLKLLADLGTRPVGLDLSRALAGLALGYSGQPVVVGDLRQLPFARGKFDGAWASASLLHLPRSELPGALAECRRVLRRDAPLVASVKLGRGGGPDETGRWYTYFCAIEWKELLQASGFTVVSVDTEETSRFGDDVVRPMPWLTSFSPRGMITSGAPRGYRLSAMGRVAVRMAVLLTLTSSALGQPQPNSTSQATQTSAPAAPTNTNGVSENPKAPMTSAPLVSSHTAVAEPTGVPSARVADAVGPECEGQFHQSDRDRNRHRRQVGRPRIGPSLYLRILTSIVALGAILVTQLSNRRSTIQKSNEDEQATIQLKLNTFYGPYLQISNTNELLARELRSHQPVNFRTLLLMLDPGWRTTLTKTDQAIVDEIIRNDAALDTLLREKAGLVDNAVQPYLWRASAHFRIIQLAHEGKLDADGMGRERFDLYVYPRQLDSVLKLEVKRLQDRSAHLQRWSTRQAPPLQPLVIDASLVLPAWPEFAGVNSRLRCLLPIPSCAH